MREKLVEKIRRLLALSTSSNKHEAQLAMTKASEIMAKHRVSLSEVEVEREVSTPVDSELYVVNGLRMKYHWVMTLARAAALLFGGEVLGQRTLHETSFFFVGKPDAIAAAKSMFEYLYKAWGPMCEADLKQAKADLILVGAKATPAFTMKFKASHGHAFAETILERAEALAAEQEAAGNNCTAIVLANGAQIAAYVKANSVQTAVTVSHGSEVGCNCGEAAGKRIPLGGLGAGVQSRMLANDLPGSY
jgi:hypothetical protein